MKIKFFHKSFREVKVLNRDTYVLIALTQKKLATFSIYEIGFTMLIKCFEDRAEGVSFDKEKVKRILEGRLTKYLDSGNVSGLDKRKKKYEKLSRSIIVNGMQRAFKKSIIEDLFTAMIVEYSEEIAKSIGLKYEGVTLPANSQIETEENQEVDARVN